MHSFKVSETFVFKRQSQLDRLQLMCILLNACVFERQYVLLLVHNSLRLTLSAFKEHNLSLQLSLETLDIFLAVLVINVDVHFYLLARLES